VVRDCIDIMVILHHGYLLGRAMVKIRPIRLEDFKPLCEMLNERGVEPPAEPSDCAGIFLIAEDDGRIRGSIYALVGQSTKAYGDYFIADTPQVGWVLLQSLMTVLRLNGIKRIDFMTELNNEYFEKQAIKYGCTRLRDLKHWRCEL